MLVAIRCLDTATLHLLHGLCYRKNVILPSAHRIVHTYSIVRVFLQEKIVHFTGIAGVVNLAGPTAFAIHAINFTVLGTSHHDLLLLLCSSSALQNRNATTIRCYEHLGLRTFLFHRLWVVYRRSGSGLMALEKHIVLVC